MRTIKARLSLEFAALTAVVCFALVAMKTYMTRAHEGRLKALADDIGPQYDPQATTSDSTVTTNETTQEYMVFDTNAEYVGTAVLTVSDQDVSSTETVSAASSATSGGASTGGAW